MALTEKEKNVLTAGLIVAGMFLIIFVYLQFFFFKEQITRNTKSLTTITADIAKLKKEFDEMSRFLQSRREVEAMKKKLEVATRKLPGEPRAMEFLEELRTSLERTGVKQSLVSPKAFVTRALYTEIPYEVQGSARFHEFGQFLNLIECNPRRFMRVSAFDIRNSEERPTVHPVSVGISTFMFNRSE